MRLTLARSIISPGTLFCARHYCTRSRRSSIPRMRRVSQKLILYWFCLIMTPL